MQRALFALSSAFALACSHGTGGPAKQADGSYLLSCKGPLTDCLQRAERVCRDEGYTVITAHDARELLGNASGQSQVAIQKSDAVVHCGYLKPAGERPMIELKRERPIETSRAPEPDVSVAATSAAPELAARACIPGATQACIGPGGCSGGQACASDGNRFDACDCGRATVPAP